MTDSGSSSMPEALKAAASAAAVGAAVGAARAYSARRHDAEDEHAEDVPESEHEAPEEEPEEEPEDERPAENAADERASLDDAGRVVRQARQLLHDLQGSDAESVSSIARGRDGWVVGLEVVEVRRIPDSTDVLATYEVELAGDGSLLRFERVRRYHRSEAGRGGRS